MEEVIHGPEEFKTDEEIIDTIKPYWDDKIKAMKNRFKKKPEYVNAIQFNGNSNKQDIEEFIGMKLKARLESETAYVAGAEKPIFSLFAGGIGWFSKARIVKGRVTNERIFKGDWLVCGAHGDYSVMTDEIFRANYEEA